MAEDYDSNRQFEQVLNRLDALMKRGQTAEPIAPPAIPATPALVETMPTEVAPESAEAPEESSDTPFVLLEAPNEIPVLTEVYDGTQPQESRDEGSMLAEAVIDALMPLMLENLDIIVAEEAARMQQNIAERLRVEIASTLRDRLQSHKS